MLTMIRYITEYIYETAFYAHVHIC